eukprot:4965548-Pyramimonas_sp.AAC.1
MHCCVGPPSPITDFGQLQNTISAEFPNHYPSLNVSSAIVYRRWVEGLSSGYAEEYVPMFVFFTFPPYFGSEGKIWYPSRIEWSVPADVPWNCLVQFWPEINSATLSSVF